MNLIPRGPVPGMPPGMPFHGFPLPGFPLPGGMVPHAPTTYAPSHILAQQGLPPAIIALFAPRPPIPFKAPNFKRKMPPLTGIAAYASLFETEKPSDLKPYKPIENKRQKLDRLQRERKEKNESNIKEGLKTWDPAHNTDITQEPLNTLFVARVNYETTEQKLRREFEEFGPIKKICIFSPENCPPFFYFLKIKMIHDLQGKPRGYAFVEFERDKDMIGAYRHADGRKIDNRRVLVDVEKGRTVRNWKPRRLGGGLGATRAGGETQNKKYSGREPMKETERERPRSPRIDREVAPSRREPDRERPRSPRGGDRDRGAKDRDGRDRRDDRGDKDRGDRDRDRDKDRDRDRDRRGGYSGGGNDRRGDEDRNKDRDRGRGRYDRPR